MKLALVFDKAQPYATGVYYERACRTLGLSYDHWWLRDVAKIPTHYELFLRVDHGDDYLAVMPDRLRPAVFYAIDTHLPHTWRKIQKIASHYDLIYCAQRDGASRLPGAEWLPLACDVEMHGHREEPIRWDVAFVGNDGGVPRKFFLQALRERYPNSFIGNAQPIELASIYSQAKVGVNYSIANDVNMRIFEVLAAGTLLVTNALDGDDLQQLGLEDRQHLVLYRNPRELIELIDYFLAHPEERQAIAQAGASVVLERHRYTHRMKQLLFMASERLGLSLPQTLQETISCASS